MARRYNAFLKKITPFLGAGLLLQTGGCDLSGSFAGLLTSVAQAIIQDVVLGVFGLNP